MKKQVLVVDDDLNICREIKDALQDETTDVQYTLPAEKILPEYMRQPFCIVIMDVSLTNVNEIAMLETMRQAKPIPILVLSPVSNTADRVKLLQAGATAVLEKPCDMEECLANAQSLMHIYLHSHTEEQGCYTLAFGSGPWPITARMPPVPNFKFIRYTSLKSICSLPVIRQAPASFGRNILSPFESSILPYGLFKVPCPSRTRRD